MLTDIGSAGREKLGDEPSVDGDGTEQGTARQGTGAGMAKKGGTKTTVRMFQ